MADSNNVMLFLRRLWRGELPSQTGEDRKRSAESSRHIGAPGGEADVTAARSPDIREFAISVLNRLVAFQKANPSLAATVAAILATFAIISVEAATAIAVLLALIALYFATNVLVALTEPGSSGVGRRRAVFALIIGCAVVPLALLSWRSQSGSTARTGQNSSYPYTISLGWGKPKATVGQDGTASVKFTYDAPLFYADEADGHAEKICKTVHKLAENRGDVRTIKVEVCVEFRQFDQQDRYGHFYKVPASTGCDTIPFEDIDEVRKYTEPAYIGKMQSTVRSRLVELNRHVSNRQGF